MITVQVRVGQVTPLNVTYYKLLQYCVANYKLKLTVTCINFNKIKIFYIHKELL